MTTVDHTKLELFLIERRNAPFEWGKNDCCLFVADAVLAITGVDYAKSLRGYRTRLGAARRLVKAGGLCSIVSSILEPQAPLLAKRGDVVMFHAKDGHALGLCVGSKFAAAGPEGTVFFDMSYAKRAWKCPRQ